MGTCAGLFNVIYSSVFYAFYAPAIQTEIVLVTLAVTGPSDVAETARSILCTRLFICERRSYIGSNYILEHARVIRSRCTHEFRKHRPSKSMQLNSCGHFV